MSNTDQGDAMRNKKQWLVLRSAVAGSLATGIAHAAAGEWPHYVNPRYRYSLCYPAALLRPDRQAPNGDGRVFHAADGGTLAVFGRNDVSGVGLDATVTGDAADLARGGGRINYRAGHGNWRVVSGTDASGAIFYSKTLRRGDQFAIFELHYPAAARDRYQPIVARLSDCFAMLR